MEFKNPYWSTKTKIELLQKWILVHSILYYELDNGIVSDAVYDANAKLLAQLAKADHGAYIASKWHSVFKGFGKDGCYSGFNLCKALDAQTKQDLIRIAQSLTKEEQNGLYKV